MIYLIVGGNPTTVIPRNHQTLGEVRDIALAATAYRVRPEDVWEIRDQEGKLLSPELSSLSFDGQQLSVYLRPGVGA